MSEPPSIRIRRASEADAAVIAELGQRTFEETFAAHNTPEDMRAYVALAFGVAQQLAELRNPKGATLLAEIAGEAAAYAQLERGPRPPEVVGPRPVQLRRFYVDRRWHGQGIAQRLMQAAREEAIALGGETFWLAVWEHNDRALAFYRRCGFTDVGSQSFVLGEDVQTDRLMVAPLAPDRR